MKLLLIMPTLNRHVQRVSLPRHSAVAHFPSFDGIFGRGRFVKDISGRSVAQKQEVLIHNSVLLLKLPFVHSLGDKTTTDALLYLRQVGLT